MMRPLQILSSLILLTLLTACEKEIDLDLPQAGSTLVVEGRIESGSFPFLFLTRNTSFFGTDNFSNLTDLYVHDAVVTVQVDGNDYVMDEYCLSTLPPALLPLLAEFLGVTPDSLPAGFDLCAYLSLDVIGEVGKRYDLRIVAGDQEITGSTAIPSMPPIDSMWTMPHPTLGDSMVILWVQFQEPDTLGNFYRYFTKANNEPFYPGLFGSVWDDQFTNGEMFRFNLDRGYARTAEIDFSTYGLFRKGDTIVVNFNMIDRPHHRFWNTLEDQLRSGGPFASPTYVISNVEGGLGVWGGYGSVYDTLVVPM